MKEMKNHKIKNTKKIINNLRTTILALATFAFSLLCIFFVVFIVIVVFVIISSPTFAASVEKSPAEKFQEAMQYANSQRNTIQMKDGNFYAGTKAFKPQEVFKEQKGGYTEEPSQTGYYSITQTNAHEMEKEAVAESSKNEDYK